MNVKRAARGPKLLLLTLPLVIFYVYGYVDRIGENNRSITVYAEESTLDD